MAGTSRRAPLVLSPTDAHRHQRAGVCASLRVERSISHLPVNNQVNQSDRNSNLPRSVIAAAAVGPGPDGPQQIKDCGGVMVAADGLLGGKVQKFLQAQRKVVIGALFFFHMVNKIQGIKGKTHPSVSECKSLLYTTISQMHKCSLHKKKKKKHSSSLSYMGFGLFSQTRLVCPINSSWF